MLKQTASLFAAVNTVTLYSYTGTMPLYDPSVAVNQPNYNPSQDPQLFPNSCFKVPGNGYQLLALIYNAPANAVIQITGVALLTPQGATAPNSMVGNFFSHTKVTINIPAGESDAIPSDLNTAGAPCYYVWNSVSSIRLLSGTINSLSVLVVNQNNVRDPVFGGPILGPIFTDGNINNGTAVITMNNWNCVIDEQPTLDFYQLPLAVGNLGKPEYQDMAWIPITVNGADLPYPGFNLPVPTLPSGCVFARLYNIQGVVDNTKPVTMTVSQQGSGY